MSTSRFAPPKIKLCYFFQGLGGSMLGAGGSWTMHCPAGRMS